MFTKNLFFNNGSYSIDSSTASIVNATGVTDQNQIYAVNNLVVGLKGYSLWDKIQALYGFVSSVSGGTFPGYKFNWKNPVDSDAAFRLTFDKITFGSVTPLQPQYVSSFNGGYANTYYTPSIDGTLNDQHIAFYSLTNGNNASSVEIGASSGGTGPSDLKMRLDNGTEFIAAVNSPEDIFTPHPFSDNARGFFVASRTSSTEFKIYRNGSLGGTGTLDSNSLATVSVYLLAINNFGNPGSFSPRSTSFVSIGKGLTDSDVANYNTLVQNYLTSFGRATY